MINKSVVMSLIHFSQFSCPFSELIEFFFFTLFTVTHFIVMLQE